MTFWFRKLFGFKTFPFLRWFQIRYRKSIGFGIEKSIGFGIGTIWYRKNFRIRFLSDFKYRHTLVLATLKKMDSYIPFFSRLNQVSLGSCMHCWDKSEFLIRFLAFLHQMNNHFQTQGCAFGWVHGFQYLLTRQRSVLARAGNGWVNFIQSIDGYRATKATSGTGSDLLL